MGNNKAKTVWLSLMLILLTSSFWAGGCGYNPPRHPTKEDIPELIENLNHRNWKARMKAVYALYCLGSDAKEAVPNVIGVLDDPHWEVRLTAVTVLGNFTSEPDVVHALASCIDDEDLRIRRIVIAILHASGDNLYLAFPAIIKALEDEDGPIRDMAIDALDGIDIAPDEIVSAVVGVLKSPNQEARVAALSVLGNIGPEEGVIPPIFNALDDEDSKTRAAAAEALGEIGPEPGVVLVLIEVLGDEVCDVRECAVIALGRLGPDAKDAVGILIGMVQEDGSEIPQLACKALGNIGPDASEAVPILVKELHENDVPFTTTRKAIESINQGKHIIEILSDRFSLEDPRERLSALEALFGNSAQFRGDYMYGRALRNALKNEFPDVRDRAAHEFTRFGGTKETIPVLVEALGDDDPERRLETYLVIHNAQQGRIDSLKLIVQTLIKEQVGNHPVGPVTVIEPITLPKILGLLTHTNEDVRWAAARTLNDLDTDFSKYFSTLVNAMSDENPGLRMWAMDRLCEIDTDIGEAIPAIIEAIGDRPGGVQRRAQKVLRKMGEDALPVLIEALNMDDPEIRAGVAQYLGVNLPYSVKATVPALMGILDDERKTYRNTVRHNAAIALMQIEPDTEDIAVGFLEALKVKDVNQILLIIESLVSVQISPIPGLIKAVEGRDGEVFAKGITVLGMSGYNIDKAIPMIIRALTDKSTVVPRSAIEALGGQLRYSEDAVRALIIVLNSYEPELRALAAKGLGRGRPTDDILGALIEALGDNYYLVREYSAVSLGGFGQHATKALPKLKKLSENDEESSVRLAAIGAIGKIMEGP